MVKRWKSTCRQLSKKEYKYRCKVIAENHLKKECQVYLDSYVKDKNVTYKGIYLSESGLLCFLTDYNFYSFGKEAYKMTHSVKQTAIAFQNFAQAIKQFEDDYYTQMEEYEE